MHDAFQAMLDFNKLHDVKEVYRMMQLIYEIGERLGGEVRTFSERIGSTDRISSRKRRGHWHGHWRGTGQAKQIAQRYALALVRI